MSWNKEAKEFFKGKRPWSNIKDEVLRSYITPYLSKVNQLGRQILLVDGFAGNGFFDDGAEGSPIILCQAAEVRAGNNYHAIFVNNDVTCHQALTDALTRKGFIGHAEPVLGDAATLLQRLPHQLGADTAFIYLDPFGLEGCDFHLLEPFLTRPQHHSTEILLNLSVPILHRLAGRNVRDNISPTTRIRAYHDRLTKLFDGTYWQQYLWQEDADTHEREGGLIEAYASKLRTYLPYVGYCPVRDSNKGRTRYYMLFASRHPDAIRIMNDSMANAYHTYIHRKAYQGTLFEQMPWYEARSLNNWTHPSIQKVILDSVNRWPGQAREDLWLRIINGGQHFAHYNQKEYRAAIKELYGKAQIRVTNLGPTKQLNDKSRIFVP